MEHGQAAIEKNGRADLFGAENSREEKLILRLFIVLLACMVMVSALHSIGQVMLIAHMCA